MITANKLTKRFGSFTAIRDVSFQIEPGEIVGFLGPNGAGKSTTMRILGGVFPPTSGQAIVAGYDVVADPLRARAAVGYFPERVALYVDMTVREYLTFVAEMKGLGARRGRNEVDRVLEACAVAAVAHRLVGTLSKGYRQRVGIAQALIGHAPVLILDEPTSGLDPEQVHEMRRLIRALRSESTVILSTHILSEVEATCDRVIILRGGRVMAVDTPGNLNRLLRPACRVHVEARADADTLAARLRALPAVRGVSPAPAIAAGAVAVEVVSDPDCDVRAEIAATVAAAGWPLLELRPVVLSLEDIFLSVVASPPPAAGAPPP